MEKATPTLQCKLRLILIIMEVGMSPYDVAKLDVEQQNAVIQEQLEMEKYLKAFGIKCAFEFMNASVYDFEFDMLQAKLDFYNKYKGTENEEIALQIISSNK